MLHVDQLLCLVSEASPAVRRQAAYLAESFGATLHVLAIEEGTSPKNGRQKRERPLSIPEGSGELEVVSPRAESRSVEAIHTYVEENDVDLVAVDTPADRGPVPPLADSFVGRLMTELDQPVYAVGQVADPERIRRILVPTDLSDHSLGALKHAAGLASIYGGSIVLLHVIDQSPYVALTTRDRLSLRGSTLPEYRARRRLRNFVEAGQVVDVSIQSHLKFGDPADQIGHFVEQEHVNLVVLGSHGATPSREPLGTVADRVLRRVNAPTFLVKSFGRSLLTEPRSQFEADDADR